MKNHWIKFYSGNVTVKVTGKGLERFLNTLTKSEIVIWNVKRHGSHSLTLRIGLDDVQKIRHVVRNSDCKVEFLERHGFPFYIKRLLKNSGFLVGASIFLGVILLLSNMVWGIEIKGATPATEYKIKKQLDEIGIKKGKIQFFLRDVESIQRNLSSNIQELTWVGVELEGTTYHFQVVEKDEPTKPEQLGPRNLVAKKKAVIADMFVEEGQPLVSVHDHVEKGQLLVSGSIGKEGETKQVGAKGKVFGETWYKSQVELPLKSTFQVFTGNEKRKLKLKVGNLSLTIWGFGEHNFNKYEIDDNVKSIHFLKWTLPISFVQQTYRESENIARLYEKDKAIEVAKEMARADIKNQLPEDASIKGEKILHQSVENGKVKLSILFQIIENIAEGQPIIPGDSEEDIPIIQGDSE